MDFRAPHPTQERLVMSKKKDDWNGTEPLRKESKQIIPAVDKITEILLDLPRSSQSRVLKVVRILIDLENGDSE